MKKLLVIKEGQHTDTEMYIKAIKKEAENRNVLVDVVDITSTTEKLQCRMFYTNKKNIIATLYDGIIVANPISKDNGKALYNLMLGFQKQDIDNYTGLSLYPNCTLQAIIDILKEKRINISSKDVVVLGRNLGQIVADYMQSQDATVTICHSKTRHLKLKTVMADIVICCADAGKKILTPDMVASDTLIIDVGGNVEVAFKNIVTFREIGRRNIDNIFKHMEV